MTGTVATDYVVAAAGALPANTYYHLISATATLNYKGAAYIVSAGAGLQFNLNNGGSRVQISSTVMGNAFLTATTNTVAWGPGILALPAGLAQATAFGSSLSVGPTVTTAISAGNATITLNVLYTISAF
jgi:hypothetical protein